MKRKSFTIKLSKWARTEGTKEIGGEPALFTGKRYCCLGFYCKSFHGKTDEQMQEQGMPANVGIHKLQTLIDISDLGVPPHSINTKGYADDLLQEINDSGKIPRGRKIKLIKAIFKKFDITVKVAA